MVIITYKCDKCGKEETANAPMGYAGINGHRFDICRECLSNLGLVTEEMMKKKSIQETLQSIMDKTAVPFE